MVSTSAEEQKLEFVCLLWLPKQSDRDQKPGEVNLSKHFILLSNPVISYKTEMR